MLLVHQLDKIEKRVAALEKQIDTLEQRAEKLGVIEPKEPQPKHKFVVKWSGSNTRAICIATLEDTSHLNKFGKTVQLGTETTMLHVSSLYDFDEVLEYVKKLEH